MVDCLMFLIRFENLFEDFQTSNVTTATTILKNTEYTCACDKY